MKSSRTKVWLRATLCGFGLLATAAVGCQSTIGGDSRSENFIPDDVEYFVAGPEDRIPSEHGALEEDELRQKNIQNGLADQTSSP